MGILGRGRGCLSIPWHWHATGNGASCLLRARVYQRSAYSGERSTHERARVAPHWRAGRAGARIERRLQMPPAIANQARMGASTAAASISYAGCLLVSRASITSWRWLVRGSAQRSAPDRSHGAHWETHVPLMLKWASSHSTSADCLRGCGLSREVGEAYLVRLRD